MLLICLLCDTFKVRLDEVITEAINVYHYDNYDYSNDNTVLHNLKKKKFIKFLSKPFYLSTDTLFPVD